MLYKSWRVGYATPMDDSPRLQETALAIWPASHLDGQNGSTICLISPESAMTADDCKNATLIAAAPDLLNMLMGPQPGTTAIDWVSALLQQFKQDYRLINDEDPDATATMIAEVEQFISTAKQLIKPFEVMEVDGLWKS